MWGSHSFSSLALLPAAFAPGADAGWIVRFAPARSSWHGFSIEDGLLAFVGLIFVVVLMFLTAGDSAD